MKRAEFSDDQKRVDEFLRNAGFRITSDGEVEEEFKTHYMLGDLSPRTLPSKRSGISIHLYFYGDGKWYCAFCGFTLDQMGHAEAVLGDLRRMNGYDRG